MTIQLSIPGLNSTPQPSVESATSSTPQPSVESKLDAIYKFCKRDKSEGVSGGVGTYHKGQSNIKYYRFSYRLNGWKKQRHIPGGCVGSPLAEKRAAIIRSLCAQDTSVLEVLEMISAFK